MTAVPTDPGLAVTTLVADSLMVTLGLRFGLYAHRNVRAAADAESTLWRQFRRVGVAGALFGTLGLVEIVAGTPTRIRDAVWLAFLLALVASLVAIERRTTGTGDGSLAWAWGFGLAIAAGGVVAVVASGPWLVGYEAVVALALAAYGLGVGRRYFAASALEGTALDSILRHLLPLSAFGGLALGVDAARLLAVDPTVVGHVRVVFVIMTATGLLSATIKLRQHLGGVA
jgi:hypothetical protein